MSTRTSSWRDRRPRRPRYQSYRANLVATPANRRPFLLRWNPLGASWRAWLLAAAAAFLTWVFLIGGNRGLIQYLKLRGDAASLKGEIQQLESQKAKLQVELSELQRNPAAVEKKAREELEMTKPGEEVYYWKKKKDRP